MGEFKLRRTRDWIFAKSLLPSTPPAPMMTEDNNNNRRRLPNWLTRPEIRLDAQERQTMRQCDAYGNTRLHLAIRYGFQNLALKIIDTIHDSAFINAASHRTGYTALHLAVLHNFPRVVWKLLALGARVDVFDKNLNSPLHLACKYGNVSCVRAILSASDKKLGKCLNSPNGRNSTCVHLAGEKEDILNLLRLKGALPKLR